ncbi:SMI1/KNR4 family protein [Paenibacillus silvae]|jgi:cell wall assembly regulator SMI1|uniref:SMI1/KNR4 family protein n=1 Tax=Paenibacillus silvae TaxID=1325358 RepID=UPI0025A23139|nr:SMI1/KNR4 family protein [Paenibacillus silvae]MDM5278274.1 SMI1/KNR4 family protein [Paenibacillus silvae]
MLKNSELKRNWDRLILNYEKKYKGFSKNFNKGVSENELQKYEAQFGFKLPEHMKELYSICNGDNDRFIAGSILGMKFLTIEKVYKHWKLQNDLLSSLSKTDILNLNAQCTSLDPKKVKCQCFNPLWIPIADDSGGNYIGIDLDPDEHGEVGQIINFGRDENEKLVIANNMNEFVIQIADVIESDECKMEKFEGQKVFVFNDHWHAIDYLKAKRN